MSTHAQQPISASRSPVFSHSDIEHFTNSFLANDEDAHILLSTVYEEYAETHRLAWLEVEQGIKAARKQLDHYRVKFPGNTGSWTSDGDDFGRSQILLQWDRAQFDMSLQFESDAAAVLPVKHWDEWRGFLKETHRRQRRRYLDPGQNYHIYDNLSLLVDSMELSDAVSDSIQETVENYIIEYDQALERAFDKSRTILEKQFAVQSRLATGDITATEDEQELAAEYHQVTRKIELVNEQFMKQLKQILSIREAGELSRMVLTKFNPKIYQSSIVDRIVEILGSDESLQGEIQVQLQLIYTQYITKRDHHLALLVTACYKWSDRENSEERYKLYGFLLRQQREGLDVNPEEAKLGHPGMQHLQKLLKLEDRTCRDIQALLAPIPHNRIPEEVRILLVWKHLG